MKTLFKAAAILSILMFPAFWLIDIGVTFTWVTTYTKYLEATK